MVTDKKAKIAEMNEWLVKCGLRGTITDVTVGPVVTTYKFEPAAGIKLSTIKNKLNTAENRLALCVSYIPNTGCVGIEVPNIARETVALVPLLENKKFTGSKYVLPIAVGVTTAGKPVYYDLRTMPHLMIGGRTGGGKTQLIYSIISSVIKGKNPTDCKLLIIDAKGVDYGFFDNVKHLVRPVVKLDADESVRALQSVVEEVECRYNRLRAMGVSTIDRFNKKAASVRGAGGDESVDIDISHMPYLVVVVDELADLMATAKGRVTKNLVKLAQRGRAVGVHLVVATQRVTADTLPGALRANFPSRIAFQTRSSGQSVAILGDKGAEMLQAPGDALFSEAGRVPLRIHTPFVSDVELKKLVS